MIKLSIKVKLIPKDNPFCEFLASDICPEYHFFRYILQFIQ